MLIGGCVYPGMMRIYLVQHADALPKEVDPQRELSERGRRDAARLGDALKLAGVRPRSILHSGKARTSRTAEIIARTLGGPAPEEADALEPLADPMIWLERLREIEADLMLVGHMPHLGRLCSRLLTGGEALSVMFVPGSAVCLERQTETWSLAWMLTPVTLPRGG